MTKKQAQCRHISKTGLVRFPAIGGKIWVCDRCKMVSIQITRGLRVNDMEFVSLEALREIPLIKMFPRMDSRDQYYREVVEHQLELYDDGWRRR